MYVAKYIHVHVASIKRGNIGKKGEGIEDGRKIKRPMYMYIPKHTIYRTVTPYLKNKYPHYKSETRK